MSLVGGSKLSDNNSKKDKKMKQTLPNKYYELCEALDIFQLTLALNAILIVGALSKLCLPLLPIYVLGAIVLIFYPPALIIELNLPRLRKNKILRIGSTILLIGAISFLLIVIKGHIIAVLFAITSSCGLLHIFYLMVYAPEEEWESFLLKENKCIFYSLVYAPDEE